MSEFNKRFLSDDEGNASAMGLTSELALLFAAALALAVVADWGSSQDQSELVFYFLVAAFAPKAVRKFAERD